MIKDEYEYETDLFDGDNPHEVIFEGISGYWVE